MGSPSINPKFKDFVCFDNVNNLPWVRPYDINRDGKFGVDDMKAILPTLPDSPIDEDEDSLLEACTRVRIRLVHDEADWKLRDLIAKSPGPLRSHPILREMDSFRAYALARIKDLDAGKKLAVTDTVRSTLVEMDLRARNIVKDETTNEPFAVGLGLTPIFVSSTDWNMKIADIHPSSSAWAAGVEPGDILLAVDGYPIREYSWDDGGTPAGLFDPKTQSTRGMAGTRGSEVRLSLQRGDRKFDVVLKRNIWTARHLGTPIEARPWDGQEHPKPPVTPMREEPPLSGCSFNPGARP